MRRSTVITMVILMVGFGGLLLAASQMLAPLAEDAQIARDLERFLGEAGDIAPDTRVRAARARGGGERLAPEGRGILVELRPSEAVRAREGGLQRLLDRVAREVVLRYGVDQVGWIEFDLIWRRPSGAVTGMRTILYVGTDGLPADPQPPVPATSAPSVPPTPPAPSAPSPGSGPEAAGSAPAPGEAPAPAGEGDEGAPPPGETPPDDG